MLMRFLLGTAIAVFWTAGFGIACSGLSSETQGADMSSDAKTGNSLLADTMPANADSIAVGFRDLNFYTSNKHFCMVSIVDNASNFWQKIWLRAQLLDAAGNILTINGDSSLLIRAFSDAVPPRGATSFFVAVPLDQVSGTPVSCHLEGAGAIQKSPGSILLASSVSGVRVLYPDEADSTKQKETTFNLQATIDNPLSMNAYHPRVVLLVYGKDSKLYFAQMLNPEVRDAPITQEIEGPISAGEKRKIFCQIFYEMLPEPLQDLLIGRVDVQAFDSR